MGFIVLGGMLGSGKTGVALQFAGVVQILHADLIHHAVAEIAFPFLERKGGLGKRLVVAHRDKLDLLAIFRVYVEKLPPELDDAQDVLIEGEIVSRRWFLNPLLRALCERYPHCRHWRMKNFALAPPAEVVFERIHQRARERAARAHEAEHFPTLDLVQARRAWYFETLRDLRGWEVHECSQSLAVSMADFLWGV
jgi:hypothetical protein